MQVILEVNPADIRFTQASISLYFQSPYDHFSIRRAVRKISKKKMRPDHFPPIRVNSLGGCLWSVDNRRLWVFRLARCSSIAVKLVKKIHPRVIDVLSDPELHSMVKVKDFFPIVRDRGQKDPVFDRLFPVPSLQRPVDEAFETPPINIAQVSNVDTDESGTSTMPPKPSINHVQEKAKDEQYYSQICIDITEECGTTELPKQSIHPTEDPANDKHQHETVHTWNVFATEECGTTEFPKQSIHPTEDPANDKHQHKTVHTWNVFAIVSVGRMIRNAVGSFFWNMFSVARKAAAAAARKIASLGRRQK